MKGGGEGRGKMGRKGKGGGGEEGEGGWGGGEIAGAPCHNIL